MRISDWSSDVCSSDLCDILRKADAVYLDEIRNAGLYDAIWQAFAVLLPVKTVGVMGDGRTYDHVCALRAVTSTDGMTADIYPFDASFLSRCATRIINEVQGINRVVYDYTSKPPGTIERSEEHTPELQSLMRIPYAVFCLKKKKQ